MSRHWWPVHRIVQLTRQTEPYSKSKQMLSWAEIKLNSNQQNLIQSQTKDYPELKLSRSRPNGYPKSKRLIQVYCLTENEPKRKQSGSRKSKIAGEF